MNRGWDKSSGVTAKVCRHPECRRVVTQVGRRGFLKQTRCGRGHLLTITTIYNGKLSE